MICTASQTDRDEKGVTENRGDAGFHDRSLPLEPDTECPRLEKAEVERRDVEPSLTDGARKIAALAPASSSLRATLCVGYPEHSHVPVLPKAAPLGAAPLAWRQVPSMLLDFQGGVKSRSTPAQGPDFLLSLPSLRRMLRARNSLISVCLGIG